MSVTSNRFRSINGSIDRAERVDTSFSDLDFTRSRDVIFAGNSYHGVDKQVANPLRVRHTQGTQANNWTVETNGELPFGGRTRGVDSVVALGRIQDARNATVFSMPYVETGIGAGNDQIRLFWGEPVRGSVAVSVRIDT